MRLKTFLATYLLFLLILFSTIGIVSVYMTNSQMNMLREKSTREYQTISASLARDIADLYVRSGSWPGPDFSDAVETLVRGYARYYGRFNIDITMTDLSLLGLAEEEQSSAEISFIQRQQEYFIHVTGVLPPPFQFYRLDYYFNITQNVEDMRGIQRVLLVFSIIFSVVTAFGLYFILLRIFRPLGIVANTSQKIADGNYGERIEIFGKNELASMAFYFNQMAEQIENQIGMLEDEAAKKQQFIDNFAHEIRTPLTSIYGYAEYIQKTPYNEENVIESTQTIMNEASHMKNIANSLLKLATLRNYTPVKRKIVISNLFENVSLSLKKSLEDKNIQLIFKNEIEVLEAQEDLIKSLLLNLCFNAINSCKDGGVIYVEAKNENENISLSVSDNGCGVSEKELAKITEPFYRVDKARSRAHGGAGLGLALCQQIAKVHGAEMSIKSTLGAGTEDKIIFTNP